MRLVGDLTGSVLEIGAGNGLNLAHYRQVERLTVVEPDPYMIRYLHERLSQVGYPVELLAIQAEHLPFPDESFDAVVASLVLCSVDDQRQVLGELCRVLKPGHEFRFIEHVRGEGALGHVHDSLTPVWQKLAGGCQPNRQTEAVIRSAGFEILEIERYPEGFLPHIQGRARKPEREE